MSFSRAALLVLGLSAALHAADTRLVRETEALSPAEEQTKLHVPPGFEVQLFASEPQINKPINMAFDARGRLWLSSTVEYPYAADKARWSDAQGTRVKDSRDAIKILEDTDGDGKADKVTDFADGLNIPTGVVPWHKAEHKAGCIAWSIPNIWYFADTDGNGKADHREILFGPLGYEKDTHGMCSSFRLGLDGWVYATHGFNNTSRIEVSAERWRGDGKMTNSRIPNDERSPNAQNPNADTSSLEPRHSFGIPHSSFDIPGRRIELHSGNVFRFRPDGSRVEKYTSGQVNPFGLAWDRYGNLYSADCHSSPIYQLIRGACYPSFGKPHDGLGFAPVMCEHSHGSTGICGIVYIDGGVWGPEWDDHTFVGNVVTSKVNHDHVTFTGSTPKANEQPDFLTSDDPWFRPVDLQLGPDNALYIADFYNKIIGHYEVPLDHPGRDKERGRIWRVVKRDKAGQLGSNGDIDSFLREENSDSVLAGWALGNRNTSVARLAASVAMRTTSPDFAKGLQEIAMQRLVKGNLPVMLAMEVRVLQGLRPDDGRYLMPLLDADHLPLWQSDDATPYVALLKAIGATALHSEPLQELVALGLKHASSRVRLAATEAATAHPQLSLLAELISLARSTDDADAMLKHSTKLAIREHLKLSGAFASLGDGEKLFVMDIAKAVPTADAASFLFDQWDTGKVTNADSALLGMVGRYGAPTVITQAIVAAQKLKAADQVPSISAIYNGLSERGAPASAELLQWAQELATQLLTEAGKQPEPAWISTAPADSGPKWSLQTRKCADGTEAQVLQSMIKGGGDEERRTGVLKSKTFPAPAKLTFWINGHRGSPQTEAHGKNLVRVVDAKSGEILASAFPPRNDVCQRAEFDLSKHVGKTVRLEIVDGDDGKAYAWLGITRIEPAVISVNDFQSEDNTREGLKTLAVMLQHTAPAALREKLAAHLPPRPAPPPLPVSPEQRKQLDALIADRAAAFAKAKPDVEVGANVFKMNCAACHQIKGEGGLIGPQLDGIGARGPARLCEDILDPNRNVDAHFHLHTLTMKDGSSFAGFLKAELGQINVLADATGKEHRISKRDIAKTEVTPISLMPPTFGQTLDEATFVDLLGYLLSETAGK